MKTSSSILFIGTNAEVGHHAAPLAEVMPVRILEGAEALQVARPGDMAIFFNEYFTRFRHVANELKKRRCATLYAVDGILEWRNAWEFPHDLAVHWVMRPILSHKVACIGRSQARILESWGNLGKCEVVGVPRFDRLLQRRPRPRTQGEPWTVLITTAKAPGFTPQQIERTRKSLEELKTWFDENPKLGDVPIRPRWRLTAGLDQALSVPNEMRDTTGGDLASVLEQVDAVITTPSTAMLEGMLQGLPVALLDYHNSPHYVPAAWTITSRTHIGQVLSELVTPPEGKLRYQQTVLHDALECYSPATPRFVELVTRMLQMTQECLANGKPIQFPDRILLDRLSRQHLPEACTDMRRLYSQHPVFSDLDRAILQTELGDGLLQLQKLQKEYEELLHSRELLNRHLQSQIQLCEDSVSFRLGRIVTWPLRALAELMR